MWIMKTITYEGYAPGGVAVIVETITDNRNRTASDVRHCFAKYDGTLGVTGSVGFMFDKKGVLVSGAHRRHRRGRNDDDRSGRRCGRHEDAG